jgi:tetratricopeptide (TPR) repeat protein
MTSNEALARHQAGDRAAAEILYRAALEENESDWKALHGLGVLCFEAGRRDEAIELLERAAALRPDDLPLQLNLAASYAAIGRFNDAERLFRAALARDPTVFEAQMNLANVLRDQGRIEEALAAYGSALTIDPAQAGAARQVARLLSRLGRDTAAVDAYKRAIALDPNNARLHFQLGSLYQQHGDRAAAIENFTRAVTLKPDYAAAAVNLGAALQEDGHMAEAEAAHRQAIALDPKAVEPVRNLAGMLQKRGRWDEALELWERAVELDPRHAESLAALAGLLGEMGRLEEACRRFEQAVALDPNNAVILSGLAFALCSFEQYDLARDAAERAIRCDPDHLEAYGALGQVWNAQGEVERWIETVRRGLERKPDDAGLHASLALALLRKGDYEAGWREYEWRTRTDTLAPLAKPVQAPRWEGEPLAGKTLLILREQGYGDMIQFARYAELVAEMGARVLFDVPAPLLRLCRTLRGPARLVEASTPWEAVDYEARLMSLPYRLGTRLDTIPARIPYLTAGTELKARWRERLASYPRPWIGLFWQGNPLFRLDRQRSMSLVHLRPLLAYPATYVSLQKGDAAAQIAAQGLTGRIVDWTQELKDFADTAALVDTLDLVISLDSAVGHLAGALGKPTWLMLSTAADFRWLLDRADSPWYPLHRLYRQPRPGDWDSVVAAVAADLPTDFPLGAKPEQTAR